MSYSKKPTNTLISRKGYSGFGSWLDTVGDALKGAVTFYGDSRAAQGAAGATQPVVPVAPVDTGISTTTLVVGGLALAGLAVVLLKKKKA